MSKISDSTKKNKEDGIKQSIDIFGRSSKIVRSPPSKRGRANSSPDLSVLEEGNSMDDEQWEEAQQEEEEENNDAVLLQKALMDLKTTIIKDLANKPELLIANTALFTVHEVQHRMSMRLNKAQVERQKLLRHISEMKLKHHELENRLLTYNSESKQQRQLHENQQQCPTAQQRQHQPQLIQTDTDHQNYEDPISKATYSHILSVNKQEDNLANKVNNSEKSYGQIRTRTSNSVPREWTTPPQKKTFETLLKAAKVEETKHRWTEIKKSIEAEDLHGALKGVRQLNSGSIVLESFNLEQQGKLHGILSKQKDIQFTVASSDPLLVLSGLEKGVSGHEIFSTIASENEDIVQRHGFEIITSSMKVIA